MPQIVRQNNKPAPAKTPTGGPKSAWDLNKGLKVLLYGQSGSGKTTFWATFPGPILALVCSGGNRPGELRSIDTPENRKKITAEVIESVEQLQAFINDAEKYSTVVLDHVTGFADLVIKELLGLDQIPVGKSRRAAKGESWSLVSQQQYGQMTIICKEFLRDLLTLPCNVVIIGQERTFGGKDDGVVSEVMTPTVGVAVTPSLAGWLNPACDYVLQAFKRPKMDRKPTRVGTGPGAKEITIETRGKGVEYCIRCEPHDVFMTKFRVLKGRTVPDSIVDPDYGKLVKVISG